MWTDADTVAYWSEVAAELGSERTRARYAYDPLGVAVQYLTTSPWSDDGPWASSDRGGDADDSDAPGTRQDAIWRTLWVRAVSMLPDLSRATLEAATASGRWGGRSGEGVAIAAALGIEQSTWVKRLQVAEARLAVVAPWARVGWDADRVVAGCLWPDLARAYLGTWSTSAAALSVGCSQSAAHSRLVRHGGPVITAIMATRPGRPDRPGARPGPVAGPPVG